MTTTDRAQQGTYRCPVCGHRDSVEVTSGAPARRISCSYCGVLLDVAAKSEDAVNLDVQLGEERVHG